MSTLRGPAQLADLQGTLYVPTYNLTAITMTYEQALFILIV